ncbi:MAG: hypothetical protein E7214_06670 [Clostridium sp.]|nr:hypothetical protein [Clostridium sp.]
MKKFNILCILLLIFLLQGCAFDDPKYLHLSEKNDISLYTKEIKSKLKNKEIFSLELFDTNLYKNIDISTDENDILDNFIISLTNEDFRAEELPTDKEPFQIRVTFKDGSKFIIKVFNDKLISINPWDGNYKEDIISMEGLPIHYNLYDFCKHIQKESNSIKDK